uniref:Calpain_III domain-containing protein n=1 Tax=Gongylonema pulchrum TaxID=637853 RepID=A0A183EY59_9BILA
LQVGHSSEAAESAYDQNRFPSCRFANCQNEQSGSDWSERENSFDFYNPFGREQYLPAYIMCYETKSRNIYMFPITDPNMLIGYLEGLRIQEFQRQLWHPQDTETNFYIPVVKDSYGQYQYLVFFCKMFSFM